MYICIMKTVKLSISNDAKTDDYIRVFSSIYRMAFNRCQDGLSNKEIRNYLKSRFNVNSWLVESARAEAYNLYLSCGQKSVLFGGKYNLVQFLKGNITKEEFKKNRSIALCSIGEALNKGNRLVDFCLNDNFIVFKPSRGEHLVIRYNRVKKKLAQELAKVQELADQKKMPVTVKFTDKHLFLTYDEKFIYNEAYKGFKHNRVLGIDMNPNYIGVSVIEFDKNDEFKVLHKEVFDLTALTKSSGESSQHRKTKYYTNKLKYEVIAIAHKINSLVGYWKCNKLAIEDIACVPIANKPRKITALNRLCLNKWERSILVNKLRMLSSIYGYALVEVNPAYSSIVGNFAYGNENTPDMVAASIEIARRAYKKFEKGWFYPRFDYDTLNERWKQTLGRVKSWKDLYLKIKESRLKYRFLLSDYIGNAVFSKFYFKYKWKYYIYAS